MPLPTTRIISSLSLALLALIGAYLTVVAVWAVSSVEELIGKETFHTEVARITEEQVSILIKIEDPTFYTHPGVDLSRGQGLTTVTSSIARDIFLFRHELSGIKGRLQSFYAGVFRCCKKIDVGRDVMALVLNFYLPKEKQLSFFITNSYMGSYKGESVIGLIQASSIYHGRSLPELTNREFIGLVAMLKAPIRFHLLDNPDAHKSRTDNIEKIIAGECQPNSWFDTSYEHCADDA